VNAIFFHESLGNSLNTKSLKWKSNHCSFMAILDEFTKVLLDKIIHNVISCLPLIENMSKDQNKELKEEIGMINRRDFILGAVWCIILEKFIISCYLHTGKTLSYENGMEISRYVLNKISESDLLMSMKRE
jgi:hypothetical protein